MNIDYKELEAQFTEWFADSIKESFQFFVRDFFDDYLNHLETDESPHGYEIRGFNTKSKNPEIFYPDLCKVIL